MFLVESLKETMPKGLQTFQVESSADRMEDMRLLAECYLRAHCVSMSAKPKGSAHNEKCQSKGDFHTKSKKPPAP